MVGRSRAIALAVSCLLLAGPALAQPTPQQRQKAEALVKQAIAKSQAKNHAAAIELYLQAYALVPLASLLSNVGTEYQTDKKPVEALKYFCMYLEKEPTGALANYATAQATTLEAELGDQDAATVCQPIVATPVEEPAPSATTPVETPQPMPPPKQPGKLLRVGGIAVGAFGLANLGFGVYFGVRARSYDDEVSKHPVGEPWPDDIRDIEEQGRTANRLQTVFLITGGVLVTAGVVAFAIGYSKGTSSRQYAVTPTVGPDGGGLVVGGRF